MNPLESLAKLEERVKKAEQRIPELEERLADSGKALFTMKSQNDELVTKLKRFEALERALKELFPSSPSVSTGAAGSLEVQDPMKLIQVEDLEEPLKVNTTQLRGQIAKLILEGRIDNTLVNAKAVRGKLVAEFGSAGEAWDIDTVLKELKALAAPPFRLFSFSPKNYMFRLRTGSEKRVKD